VLSGQLAHPVLERDEDGVGHVGQISESRLAKTIAGGGQGDGHGCSDNGREDSGSDNVGDDKEQHVKEPLAAVLSAALLAVFILVALLRALAESVGLA